MKIFASNLLIMSMLVLIIVVSGCTQQEVEPDPADQVLGVYSGTTYTESINGVAQSIDLTNTLIKDNITISMDVAKKSASVVAIVLRISQRDSTGAMQTYTDTYDTIDLKAMGNGEFDMQNAGISIGQVGNGLLKLQETYADSDENGNELSVTVTIAAKK